MTKEQIIRRALTIAGELWAAYKAIPDPRGRGACGAKAVLIWNNHTTASLRPALWKLQKDAGDDYEASEAARVVADVRALELAILHYISRGGTKYGVELVEQWGKIGHWMQRWGVASEAKKTGREIGLPVL